MADEYRARIRLLATPESGCVASWPGLAGLQNFMEIKHDCTNPPEISVVNIPVERGADAVGGVPASEFEIVPLEGPDGLSQQLQKLLANTTPASQLIIVENINPDTLAILGGAYDIDPEFFAEYVNVLPWYRMDNNIPERLPSLPSTKKAEDFLLMRYVDTRELRSVDNDGNSVLVPDNYATRFRHTAGKLIPLSRQGLEFPPLAFTRQTVGVWCQKKSNGSGWIAIMLVDPPFRLESAQGSVLPTEYCSPNLRPKMKEKIPSDDHRESLKRAFCYLLQQRCSTDKMYLRTCATDPFLVLYEAYRIIASQWLVANEYLKRELSNIELRLEKTESTFQELELRLKELYRIRRRCNRYHELVTEAALQCKQRGKALWPSSELSPHGNADAIAFAQCHAQELEEDLQYVLDKVATSISRIEKNINLLMALVTISEGRQGLQENRGIALLTLVAATFLPSETVATILGLQTRYGPGASEFWMLWAVALPLTILVVAIPFLFPILSRTLNQIRPKHFQKKPRAVPELLSESMDDENIELVNDPKLQTYRRSISDVV